MHALINECPYCFDTSTVTFEYADPCYIILHGAHNDWIFIDADVADRVQVLDSLGHMRKLREPVAPRMIPIPNAPPTEDIHIPPEYINYGIFGTTEH